MSVADGSVSRSMRGGGEVAEARGVPQKERIHQEARAQQQQEAASEQSRLQREWS